MNKRIIPAHIRKQQRLRLLTISYKYVSREMREHPWRWAIILLAQLWVIVLLVLQSNANAIILSLIAVSQIALSIVAARLVFKAVTSPARQVHEWAYEQNKHQQISMLKGSTTEELERMLEHHLAAGNLAEADRVSQQLMDMMDMSELGLLTSTEVADGKSVPLEVMSTSPPATGLPDWLASPGDLPERPLEQNYDNVRDSSGDGDSDPGAATNKLPDWLRGQE